jgi:hypothetical protein
VTRAEVIVKGTKALTAKLAVLSVFSTEVSLVLFVRHAALVAVAALTRDCKVGDPVATAPTLRGQVLDGSGLQSEKAVTIATVPAVSLKKQTEHLLTRGRVVTDDEF